VRLATIRTLRGVTPSSYSSTSVTSSGRDGWYHTGIIRLWP
jgi:hypothetical protein